MVNLRGLKKNWANIPTRWHKLRNSSGCGRIRYCYLLARHIAFASIALPALANTDTEQQLAELQQLIAAGASQLAVQQFDQQQPRFADDPVAWITWERVRLQLHREQADIPALRSRIASFAADIPNDFLRHANTELITALIQEKQGAAARNLLLPLLRQHPEKRYWQTRWRRLLFESYLVDKRYLDAAVEVEKYTADYAIELPDPKAAEPGIQRYPQNLQLPSTRALKRLQARILLHTIRSAEAADLVRDDNDPKLYLVKLLAFLRSSDRPVEDIAQEASAIANDRNRPMPARKSAWVLKAFTARALQEPIDELNALEKALGLAPQENFHDPLLSVSAQDLWQRLITLAPRIPPRSQHPVAVHSRLAQRIAQNNTNAAHQQLILELQKLPYGDALAEKLYRDKNRFPTAESLPLAARYLLVERLLDRSDIETAAQFIHALPNPPVGEKNLAWQMRRSRILILGGKITTGIEVLQQLLADHPRLPADEVDRLLQIVFDLQKLERHQAALSLFQQLQQRTLSRRQQREILFWMAESATALNQPRRAAELYLQSAIYNDAYALDSWARTARFQAAAALTKAGLLNDARAQYRQLLTVAKDQFERTMLYSLIEQLPAQ